VWLRVLRGGVERCASDSPARNEPTGIKWPAGGVAASYHARPLTQWRVTSPRADGLGDGLIGNIFLRHGRIGGNASVSPVTVRDAMDEKFKFLLTLRVFVLVAASGALLVVLQMSAPLVGLSRDVGIWIWAAGTLILTGLILGRTLAKEVGGRRALVVSAIMLGLGAAIYLYVVYLLPLSMNH
jgi:hypothetical protein